MRTIILSLPSAYHIKLGDTLQHPVFGSVTVQFIFKRESNDYELTCVLNEYNGTIKRFYAMDFIRIHQKRKARLRVVRRDERVKS